MNNSVVSRKSNENTSAKKTSRWTIYFLRSAVVALISVILSLPAILIYIHLAIGPLKNSSYLLLCYSLIFLLGIVSLAVIAFNCSKLKGVRYTFWAILLSVPFFLLTASGVYVNKGRAERIKITKGKQIGIAIVNYARNHNGYLLDANQWCDLLIEYDPNLSRESFKYATSKTGVCNYAFNKNLSGLRLDSIPYNTVLIFESDGQWNLNGSKDLFAKTSRKRQYAYIYDCIFGKKGCLPVITAINKKDTDYEHVKWEPSHRK